MYIKEITLTALKNDNDWAEVFADKNSGDVDKTLDIPVGLSVSTKEVSRTDVKRIIAAVNGDNDGPAWLGLFLLKDGRYLVAGGACSYTGWDCQGGNFMIATNTKKEAITLGLDARQRKRLGVE